MSQASAAQLRCVDTTYRMFGDAATYTDRNAVATPCTVQVERDLTRYGETAVVNKRTAVVEVRVSEVAAPPRHGETFTLTGSGQVLVVDSLQSTDELEHRVFAA